MDRSKAEALQRAVERRGMLKAVCENVIRLSSPICHLFPSSFSSSSSSLNGMICKRCQTGLAKLTDGSV